MESPGTAPSSTLLVLQLKSLVTFKSNDEYLYAMKEDLAEWFMCLYQLDITVDNFFEILDTGVILCEHANNVKNYASEQKALGKLAIIQSNFVRGIKIPEYEVQFKKDARPQTFIARDNISNFITWTKNVGIPEVLTFETDDLVLRKNEKSVVLCLLEIARIGAKLGMLAPTLVQMEEEIDAEIESGEPPPQIITCDIRSLDEMVKWLAGRCTCPVQFPIIKVGEGKYKIGDSQTLVFVRILRNHVMIRVGGGWDTLEHYLDKHDPCRCNFAGHRTSTNQAGSYQRSSSTPSRRSSTPTLSHTTPLTSKAAKKHSVSQLGSSGGYVSVTQRSASPVRMRSVSPGPSPRKLPIHPVGNSNSGTSSKPPVSPLSPTGNVNNLSFSGQRTSSTVPNTPRRSQSPAPSSRLRSPSPVLSTVKSFSTQQRETPQQQNRVPRPSSPVKRSSSPAPGLARASQSSLKRCTSPAPQKSSGLPSRQSTGVRSSPTTPRIDRRQLPSRPSMDSSGNDSEGTDVTSGSNSGQVDMNQISTMTLDEFKNLLNSALSVPNGNASEGSFESPRSQSSTDSLRNSHGNRPLSSKKPPITEKPSRFKTGGGPVSRGIDSKTFKIDRPANGNVAQNGYFEMEKPASIKRTILASSTVGRPKTPVSGGGVNRPKTPVSGGVVNRPKTPVSGVGVARPKTPVSTARPKTPSGIARPVTPVSVISRPKTPSSQSMSNLQRNTNVKSTGVNNVSKQTERTPMKMHESKSENSMDILHHRTTSVNSEVENVSNMSNNSENVTKPRASTFSGSKTYTFSHEELAQTNKDNTDSGETMSTSLHRSNTEPTIGSNQDQTETEVTKTDSSDSIIASFNALQKSIQELRNRAQQACISAESRKSESRSLESKPSTTMQSESRTNEAKQIESRTVVSTPTEKVELKREENKSKENFVIKRPSTPTGRPSTPSFIPRPMTPVGSSSGNSNVNTNRTKETSAETTAPPSPASGSIKRPSTPKQATIIARSPSAGTTKTIIAKSPSASNAANRSSNTSYTSKFLARRSTTPNPSEMRRKSLDSVANTRRAMTPGPGSQPSESQTGGFKKATQNLNKTFDFTAREIPESDYNESANKSVIKRSSSQGLTPQRGAGGSGLKSKPLTRQEAVDESITVTVNRQSGAHKITVKDGEDTTYRTGRSTGRIIARATTPVNVGQKTNNDIAERGRNKSRNVDVARPRPRSVDPENWNKGKEPEEVLVVKRVNNGSHVVENRTEAWVVSAAKSVTTKGRPSANKALPPRPRRCKTPNPNDIYEHELQSRPLSEIKAALSLPVNGLKEINAEKLDAPPEDPEMFATMEKLFEKMRERELKASVNETPGGGYIPELDVDCIESEDVINSDGLSLDSNENVKRVAKVAPKRPSPATSVPGSVPSTPPRSKTPVSRTSSSGHSINRPVSTPPRPSTPTRLSQSSSRRSSTKSSNDSVPTSSSHGSVNHAEVLVSKIKEILKTNPRKDTKQGPKSRIPAPKSLSQTGKSKSFSNLSCSSGSDSSLKKQYTMDYKQMNGNVSFDNDYDDYDAADEICGINANVDNSCQDKNRSQSGTKTPVPKLATPLTTGRTAVLNREFSNDKSSKLVRAVSISSLSSSSNTLSCNYGEDDDYV